MRISKTTTILASAVLASATALTVGTAMAATGNVAACTPSWKATTLPGLNAATSVSVVSRDTPIFGYDGELSVPPSAETWDGHMFRPLSAPPGQIPSQIEVGGSSSFDSKDDGWLLSRSSQGTVQQPASSGLAERWHNGQWRLTPTASNPDFAKNLRLMLTYGVHAISPSDAWIVGSFQLKDSIVSAGALTEHWNGSEWAIVPNPVGNRTVTRLYAVTAGSSRDVWAAGYTSDASHANPIPLVEHWSGSGWTVAKLPAIPVTAGDNVLTAISVQGNQVWASGYQLVGATYYPLIEHFDGSAWHLLPLMTGLSGLEITGVYAAASGDVWATAHPQSLSTTGALPDETFLHWNGKTWSAIPAPKLGAWGLDYQYSAIGGSGPDDIWAAGRVLDVGAANFKGVFQYYPVVAHFGC